MNHSFNPSRLDRTKCLQCNRKLIDHSKAAECEVCGEVGSCEVVSTILMCKKCEAKERDAQQLLKDTQEDRVEVMRDYYKLRDDIREAVPNSMSYFNAHVVPIVELKEIYELKGSTFQEYHQRIKEQILHFTQVLFEQRVEQKPDEISNLLIEFRAEVRTKLKEKDINYVPPIKAPKVAKPKSALDKAAMLLVSAAEKEGKTMTLYEAKQKLMKELGL